MVMSHVPSISGYSDLREIGSGGFSRVYEGHQLEFDRRVAIKVLNKRLADDASVAAFEQECRSMGVLSKHPYIVTVLASAFTTDHRPCIVMDLFQHGNYMQILRQDGPVPLDELLPLSVRMAGALATAHRHDVIHGDVKPQNIFRSEFGYPALGDFGIATLANRHVEHGTVGLSPHYAAPEMVEIGAAAAGGAADQYSLATTIYTLAVGRRPFEPAAGESPHQILRRMLTSPTPRLPASFPADLTAALLRAMARDPRDRYADLVAFAAALNDIENRLGQRPTSVPLAAADTGPAPAGTALVADPADRTSLALGDERTIALTTLRPQPASEQTAHDATGSTSRSQRRLVAAIAVVVAAAGVAGIAYATLRSDDGNESPAREQVAAITEDDFFMFVSDVTGLTGTMSGDSASFSWMPVEADGIVYRVLREDSVGGAPRTVDTPSVTFEKLDPAERPCVRVLAVHQPSGAMSTPGVVGCAAEPSN